MWKIQFGLYEKRVIGLSSDVPVVSGILVTARKFTVITAEDILLQEKLLQVFSQVVWAVSH